MSSPASAGTGRRSTSWCAATAIMAGRRRWRGAKPTISATFGFGGNPVLDDMIRPVADEECVERAVTGAEKLRRWSTLRYGAKNWQRQRRVVARIEATKLGLDAVSYTHLRAHETG